MRTPGMTSASAPIVTSSPIATPSWMRTCARRSQLRPITAPSTIALVPTCVEESITVRLVRAPSRSVTLLPRIEYGATVASGEIRQ